MPLAERFRPAVQSRKPAVPRAWRLGWAARSALLAGVVAGRVIAAEPASDLAGGLALDQQLQVLKEEALAFSGELRKLDEAVRYPARSRTALYVNVQAPGFLLDGISLRIDDRESATHRYTDSEARALWQGGWHRLDVRRLNPGPHRLSGEFRGRHSTAGSADPPVIGRFEWTFEKGESELDLVLPISRKTPRDPPEMARIFPAESPRFSAGADDPRYRFARFLKDDGRYRSALIELLDLLKDAPAAAAAPAELQSLLAECYLGFGLSRAAETAYRQLAAGVPGSPSQVRAQLELARFEYQRGYLEAAAQRLPQLAGPWPAALRDEWRHLQTNVLLAQGRYAETVTLLAGAADPNSLGDLPLELRYNLAVALIKSGREKEGRLQLNLLGTAEVQDPERLALRDKANVTLGYQYLQWQSAGNAKLAFSRVRRQGMFSNPALLGLGWAEMLPLMSVSEARAREAPGDGTDRRDLQDDSARLSAHDSGAAAVQDREALQRALVPWTELIGRDPMDPAVHEGLLAVSWTLERLQDDEQAIKYYQLAVDTLEAALRRMEQAKLAVHSGHMIRTMIQGDPDSERGWKWRLVDLPDTPETYFTQRLLAQHRFQEALKNYRDALLLGRTLQEWTVRVPELSRADTGAGAQGMERRLQNLIARIAQNGDAQNALLQALALQELDGQAKQIERYITEARSSIARVYERQLQGSSP